MGRSQLLASFHADAWKMFLTESELADLTGATQPAAQERILREWGLTVYRSRANKVMVSREAVIRWQLGERSVRAGREPVVRMGA